MEERGQMPEMYVRFVALLMACVSASNSRLAGSCLFASPAAVERLVHGRAWGDEVSDCICFCYLSNSSVSARTLLLQVCVLDVKR